MIQEHAQDIAEQAKPFLLKGTNGKGVLLTHGFTGSPADLLEFGQYLNDKGYTVKGVRLPGHGTTPEHLANVRSDDWQAAMNDGLNELLAHTPTVYALGNSFGGNLTYHLSRERPGAIRRIITIGSPIWISRHHLNTLLLPFVKRFRRFVKKRWVNMTQQTRDQLLESGTYLTIPLPALHEMLKFITNFTRRELPSVTTPALVMHSSRDIVVAKRSANFIFNRLGSRVKELRWIPNSYHNPFVDAADESFFAQLERFFRKDVY